ncbi:MAG TPA: DUF6690 family protein [Pirellulales bacterium]|nr:DUF6690 family protein [Pirellulales bacterium]
MLKYSSLIVVMLGAVGLPYVVSNHQRLTSLLNSATATTDAEAESEMQHAAVAGDDRRLLAGYGQPPRASESEFPLEVTPLSAALRFDVSTAWVLATWSRVSTAAGETDPKGKAHLKGYRVALVTGTGDADLAGSLTYYFNPQQRVERITFQGTTGDARPLVHLLATNYRFVRQMLPNPGLYVYRSADGKKVCGELTITPSTVIRRDDNRARFTVSLTMDRPSWL